MEKNVKVNLQTILILNKKKAWLKKKGEILHSKNIQAEKSYGNGFDKKKFAKETGLTDIKNSRGNDLIAKANVLKRFEKLVISV